MTKKKQPAAKPKPSASQPLSAERALDAIICAIQIVNSETDTDGSPLPQSRYKDALRTMLAKNTDDYIIDTYYLVCGFQSLRELDLRIIRADMLVERATRSFVESRAATPDAIVEAAYGPLRQFAKAMTEAGEDADVWVAARHLNQARNKVAHVFENATGVEQDLANFFKTLRVEPAKTPEEFEQTVKRLCQRILILKDDWIRRKKINESIVRDFDSGQLVSRK